MTKTTVSETGPLSSNCAVGLPFAPLDRIVTRTSQVVIGEFRCPVSHPSFGDTGPIQHFLVVFPRTSVWIEHEGSAPFLADPSITTIYNRGQRYARRANSEAGDRCDWFGVSDDLAREIAASLDPCAGDAERPYAFERAPVSPWLYYEQRELLARAARGDADELEIEESVTRVVAAALAAAYAERASQAIRDSTRRRRRELVDAARAELSRRAFEKTSLHEIAGLVQTSPYHLSRVFHEMTGLTLSDYRNELRLRHSLEMLDASVPTRRSISEIAHAVGFSSHSHYVSAMRRSFGTTPTAARLQLSMAG